MKEFQAQPFLNEYQDCILLTSVVQSPTTLSMTISRYSVGLNNTSLMFLLKMFTPQKVYLWLNGVEVPDSRFWSRTGSNTPGWVLEEGSCKMVRTFRPKIKTRLQNLKKS